MKVILEDTQSAAIQEAGHSVSASLTAENTFSDEIVLRGKFDVSVSGTFVGTVTVQRSWDDGVTWVDCADYTTPTETFGEQITNNILYRIGCQTGNFTSGTMVVRLSL